MLPAFGGEMFLAIRKNVVPYVVTLTPGSGNWPLPAVYNELSIEGWAGGGTGGNLGSPPANTTGGSTSFGPCSATGGKSGSVQTSNGGVDVVGGDGGTATGGDTNYAGLVGGTGRTWLKGGDGANAPDGGGLGAIGKSTGNQDALISSSPGAGGAGKYDTSGSTSYTGGGGGSGGKFRRVFPLGFFTSAIPYVVGTGGVKSGPAGAGANGEIRIRVS